MQCPLCDSSDFEIIGKTANGDRKYSCHVCNNVFTNGNTNNFVSPTINFLRFKTKPLIQLIFNRIINQILELKNIIVDIVTRLTYQGNQAFLINKIAIAEIFVVFILWLISLTMSSYVFNRPLELDAHHEFITAHTLVSLRSLDQWGIFQTLGASILVPKSNEYLQVDITVLDKDNGVYLSYPSLWLVVPYLIFKILAIPTTVASLQIYHLIFNRLFTSIIIYFLFLEIIYLFKDKFKKTNLIQGWGSKLLAFLGTAAWIFSPPVLYWSQNVYFCDQAILLPVYALLLFYIIIIN